MKQSDVYKSPEGKLLVEQWYKQALLNQQIHTPFTELTIDSCGISTHVLQYGDTSKQPVIMLHGSMSNSAAFFGAAPVLSKNFCVYCIDIPGEPGLSAPVRLPLTTNQPAEWLLGCITALGLKTSACIAMSLGSWYCLQAAILAPEKITALSLITSGGIAPQRLSFLFKAVFSRIMGAAGETWLNNLIYRGVEVPEEVLTFQKIVSTHFNPLLETLPIFSDRELSRLTMPVQYFGGTYDVLLNTEKTAERISSRIPSAEVHVLETGHVIIDQFENICNFHICHYNSV